MLASLSTFFGVVAGFLALIGLYGLLSYAVNRRIREFGVRLALGADARRIFVSVLKEALTLLVAGIAVGVPVAIATAKILASRLPNLSANDAASLRSRSFLWRLQVSWPRALPPAVPPASIPSKPSAPNSEPRLAFAQFPLLALPFPLSIWASGEAPDFVG